MCGRFFGSAQARLAAAVLVMAGIAIFPEHGDDELTLSKNADAGMYPAKDRERNRVKLFSPA